MRSKEIADLAGVSVRTLRHYHAIGLLPEPPRGANGYREYGFDDLARLLRVKRLTTLGFSLERAGAVIDELDAPESTVDGSLDELDAELAAQIERLEEQRRTIALLKRERLDPDLPVRFAQAMKMISDAKDDADGSSESERTLLQLAANVFDEEALVELENVAVAIRDRGLSEKTLDLDRRVGELPPDASENDRAALVAEAVELLAPLFDAFDESNWNRPHTPSELMVMDYQNVIYNEAQSDVFNRIYQALEEMIVARKVPGSASVQRSSTTGRLLLDSDVTS
ncbi:MerR family transcriptional regulator [Gordonibacter sp. 28C]|uniref:MerR family transcriptional regulator n=1 Tax=Gordonibacter sp. 28C TaxID=2078569 RepID=UPI000DF792BB|nr:MerR family transcriptional regulator [Gordonibacter sp. 28C]RDB61536.1 MerR family transcriptional regulator [Gordonibacter sp. 28C]